MSTTAQAPTADLRAETDYAGRQSRGARQNQEDAYGVVPPPDFGGGRSLLALLADGMGGHAAGEIASEVGVQAFVDGFFHPFLTDDASRLWAGLESANHEIKRKVVSDPALAGMGTTLVALLIRDGMARWISIGDSPLYLIRNGQIRRLNQLHLVGGSPDGSAEAASPVSQKELAGALSAAVIGDRLFEVDDPEPLLLESGDVLIAASDGLDSLPGEELLRITLSQLNEPAARLAEALIAAVEALGLPRQDNTTVVVIRWTSCEK